MRKDIRKNKLEGSRFGMLFVLEYSLEKSMYKCDCDCGNSKYIRGGDLTKGRTKSCGCLNKSRELDIVGQKFNMLTVLERLGTNENKQYLFRCKCDCGIEKALVGKEVKRGKIKSCGNHGIEKVKEANTTHGMTKTRLYDIYRNILERCKNENSQSYANYGGRGIDICDEWLDKENGFMNFYNWTIENGYSDELSIDRIDVNGNYEPSNCRWATREQQQRNKRNTKFYTYQGKTQTLIEWCNELNLTYDSVWKRINKYNYDFEKAITYKINRVKAS